MRIEEGSLDLIEETDPSVSRVSHLAGEDETEEDGDGQLTVTEEYYVEKVGIGRMLQEKPEKIISTTAANTQSCYRFISEKMWPILYTRDYSDKILQSHKEANQISEYRNMMMIDPR